MLTATPLHCKSGTPALLNHKLMQMRRSFAGSKDSARPSLDSQKVHSEAGLAKQGAATFSFGADKAALGPCLLGDPSGLAKRASRAAEVSRLQPVSHAGLPELGQGRSTCGCACDAERPWGTRLTDRTWNAAGGHLSAAG